jgi:hypothetical protein
VSRRARNRPDKWEETLGLARHFGHGTEMPQEEAMQELADLNQEMGFYDEPEQQSASAISPSA